MSKISLPDFFKYFDPNNANQLEAIVLLESMMPKTLLTDQSQWVVKYREKPEPPPAPSWPITKEEMIYIMQCPSDRLTADLMNDFAQCVADCKMDRLEMVYFLGQCGHESLGLYYNIEEYDGVAYEGRADLGNTQPGDGVKFAGQGYLQCTGRANTQDFSDYMDSIGRHDPNIMEIGKTWNGPRYPWSISGNWWRKKDMKAMCAARKECTNAQIDEIGARVNGMNRPNGADDRIAYTDRAYRTLIGV
jgi:predicted chitinase